MLVNTITIFTRRKERYKCVLYSLEHAAYCRGVDLLFYRDFSISTCLDTYFRVAVNQNEIKEIKEVCVNF